MKIIIPIAQINFIKRVGILHIRINEGAEMTLQNAKTHFQKINSLVGSDKYLALVDARNYYPIEKEAWKYASSEKVVSNRVAIALYNSSLANRITMTHYSIPVCQ